jgi:S-adenosylmethionine-dependent methyltransferase
LRPRTIASNAFLRKNLTRNKAEINLPLNLPGSENHVFPPCGGMRMLDASRFQNAEKYAAYLKTSSGRLRSELVWENLCRFLPRNASKLRALDVGGGTGFTSVRLARMGYEVVLLDSSEEMLRIAREQAGAGGVAARISFCHGDAGRLPELFDAGSFDIVVCHNLLEYGENPSAIVRDIANALRKDAVLSVLVRNRAGEVLKDAIKSRDWNLAVANLTAETVVDSLYSEPVRVFNLAEVRDLLTQASLEVVAEHGVRVFFDYLGLENLTDEAYPRIFKLESALGVRPEFAAIARYIQVIARRSCASSGEVK